MVPSTVLMVLVDGLMVDGLMVLVGSISNEDFSNIDLTTPFELKPVIKVGGFEINEMMDSETTKKAMILDGAVIV